MLGELRALFSKREEPLDLESYRVEHELDAFWVGRPSKAPYVLQVVASTACGLLALALYAKAQSSVVLLSGVLVAALYPFIAAKDWHATEYLLAGDLVVVKPGAFARGLRVHDLEACTGVEEECPRLGRRFQYRHLHLHGPDDEPLATLRNLPADVASGFLDVLELLDEESQETVITAPSRPPEPESPEVTKP